MNKTPKLFSYNDLSKYRSVLMGLQILLIIAFHYTETCKNFDIRFDGIVYLFYTYIHSSGVDLFLFLSGLGLYFSWKKNPDYKSFYKKRLLRTLIPYFIVALPAWAWADFFVAQKSFLAYIEDVFFISFFTDGTRWFWFVFMILICYLIFPYCFQIIDQAQNKVTEQMWVLTLSIATILFTVILQLYDPDLYSNLSVVLIRFPLFFVGILAGKSAYTNRTTSRHNIYIWTLLVFLAIGPIDMVNVKLVGSLLVALFNLCLCLLLIVFLNFLGQSKYTILTRTNTLITRTLSWFGQYTMELYLIHVMLRRVLTNLGHPTYRLSNFAIEIILSIALSIILKKLSTLIYNKLSAI